MGCEVEGHQAFVTQRATCGVCWHDAELTVMGCVDATNPPACQAGAARLAAPHPRFTRTQHRCSWLAQILAI
jgi:hypothetical protein